MHVDTHTHTFNRRREKKVEDPIRHKLSLVWMVNRYLSIQRLQLCLTLIELPVVSLGTREYVRETNLFDEKNCRMPPSHHSDTSTCDTWQDKTVWLGAVMVSSSSACELAACYSMWVLSLSCEDPVQLVNWALLRELYTFYLFVKEWSRPTENYFKVFFFFFFVFFFCCSYQQHCTDENSQTS